MSTSKYAKLVMVTEENNNKYYEMIYEGGNYFTINYGRIDLTKTTLQKPYFKWNSIYNEKIKKGYKDVTHLLEVEVKEKKEKETTLKKIDDDYVEKFLTLMKNYTDKLVTKTYSVKFDKVSKNQLTQAQKLIDDLVDLAKKSKIDDKLINKTLIELYSIIPRHMTKVQNYLLPSINLKKALEQEQDNLDAIASQVAMYKNEDKVEETEENEVEEKTLLDIIGLSSMKKIDKCNDIDYLLKQINSGYRRNKVEAIFELQKPEEDNRFNKWLKDQKNQSTRILIHGTRCTSVIPILKEGLKIRPAGNFQFSGKAYGEGNYFSEVTDKSLNYTGYDPDKILLVYEVHTGNPFIYNGWYRGNSFSLNYKNLKERGYDSTYVKAGNGLLNSEIIAYHEHQCRIKYIMWLK